ncbi:TPA: hypothetical protein DCX16_03310 [bacterium]|nr:hypothetical protein [bacterium]
MTSTPNTGNTGNNVTISGNLSDNVGVVWARLHYEPIYAIKSHSSPVDFLLGNVTLTIADNFVGTITYSIEAKDARGNATNTKLYMMEITDDDNPIITLSADIPDSVTVNFPSISLNGNCSDNVSVDKVILTYTTYNVSLSPSSPATCTLVNGNYWFINLTFDKDCEGSITYTVTVYDKANNIDSVTGVVGVDTKLPMGTLTITGYDKGGVENTIKTATRDVTLKIEFKDAGSAIISNNIDLSKPNELVNLTTSPYIGSWTLTSGDGEKRVYVKLIDSFGNSIVVWDNIVLDTEGPDAYSISINQGAEFTKEKEVVLNLLANQTTSKMKIWGDINTIDWTDYKPIYTVTLQGDDGTKTVYAKFRDDVENESQEVCDSIILDTSPPAGNILINGGVPYTNNISVLLSLTGTDTTSGVEKMILSNTQITGDPNGWSWQAFDTPKHWVLAPGDGEKTVYMRLKDRAGNVSEVITDTITFDTMGPFGTITIDFGGVKDAKFATSTSVTLTITCEEAGTRTITAFISNDDSFPAPVTMVTLDTITTSNISWELKGGLEEGYRTVFVKFVDQIGNGYLAADSIILDTKAPTNIHITINDGDKYTKSKTVTVTLSADSTTKKMYISGDVEGDGINTWIDYSPNPQVTLTSGDSMKTVSVKFKDEAGNVSVEISDFIYLDTTPPNAQFTVSTDVADQDQLIVFDASSSMDTITTTLGLDELIYTWSFGDGHFASGKKVSHSYKDVGEYKVELTVADVLGWNGSITKVVTVTDKTAPIISEVTGDVDTTTGDDVTIKVKVIDNESIISVKLYYTPIDGEETELSGIFNPAFGSTYTRGTFTIPVANDKIGNIVYYIVAEDNKNNKTREPQNGTYKIAVGDDEKPTISYITEDKLAGNSKGSLTIEATVTDNVKVKEARLYYTDFTRKGISIQSSGNPMDIVGNEATGVVPIPYDRVGSIIFWVEVWDTSDNKERSKDYHINVYDDVSPIGSVKINNDAGTTNSRDVTLVISGEDNIGIEQVMIKDSLGNELGWMNWQNFAGERSWKLGGDKEIAATETYVTVTVNFKDEEGNTGIVTDTIFLDTQGPTEISVLINKGAFKMSENTLAREYEKYTVPQDAGSITLNYGPVLWVRGVWEKEAGEKNFYSGVDVIDEEVYIKKAGAGYVDVQNKGITHVSGVYKGGDKSKNWYDNWFNAQKGRIYLIEGITEGTYTIDYTFNGLSSVVPVVETITLDSQQTEFYVRYAPVVFVKGIYGNPAGTGTNYYTGGKFDLRNGKISLSSPVPITDTYYVHYERTGTKDKLGSCYESRSRVVYLGTNIRSTSTVVVTYVYENPNPYKVVELDLRGTGASSYYVSVGDNDFTYPDKVGTFTDPLNAYATTTVEIDTVVDVNKIYVKFVDSSWNEKIVHSSIEFDKEPPKCRVEILDPENDNDGYTSFSTVTLKIETTDEDVEEMWIANFIGEEQNPFSKGSIIVPYDVIYKGWELYQSDVDGLKSVVVKFIDDGGNVSEVTAEHPIMYRRLPESRITYIGTSGVVGHLDMGSKTFACMLELPVGAINNPATFTVNSFTPPPLLNINVVPFTGWEIKPSMQFAKPATLTIAYSDLDNNGCVDQMKILEKDLAIFYYDESRKGWVKLGGEVDKERNCVSVQITHLCMFVLGTGEGIPRILPSTLFGDFKVKFNPYNPKEDGETEFSFELGRPADVTIKVYDTAGDLVATVANEERRQGGKRESIKWSGRKTDGGKYLKPGLYVFQIRVKADGESIIKTGLIAIVR